MNKNNEEWQKLSFQEIKIGMRIKASNGVRGVVLGVRGVVLDKSEGALYVKFEGEALANVLFSYEIESCLFSTIKKHETKVLSKQEIYEMLLSDATLHSVSLKAVRKIEKAILDKLRSEDDSK